MTNREKEYFKKIFNESICSKEEVRNRLKKLYNRNLPLTSKCDFVSAIDNATFTYNYQRYDSTLEYKDFEKNFYNIDKINSKTIFTNCGMSSIFAVLFSLFNSGKYNIIYEKDTYFETQKIIKELKLNKGKKVFYLDTISNNFSLNPNLKNKIIIIDTTCYHSHSFKKMICQLLKNNNFLILVRSHVKLDMLGMEYSYLGSIVFCVPEKINNRKFKCYKKIIQNTMNCCGNIGLLANQDNIFPLLCNSELVELNKERITRIKNNNRYFYNCNKKLKNLFLHSHELFLTVILEEYKVGDIINMIKKYAEDSNGLFYYSASFGFDYIAMDTYFDLNTNKNTIRISIGDVDKETLDKFIDYFKEVLYDKI